MDIHRLKPLLDRLMQTDEKWNFDLEDCDHILRVETWSVLASTIIAVIENAGFRCEELEDVHPLPVHIIRSIEPEQTMIAKILCRY